MSAAWNRPTWTRAQFTIPMRGNEEAQVLLSLVAPGFTIPMRGNERLSAAAVATAMEFTIPMRGNEPLAPVALPASIFGLRSP